MAPAAGAHDVGMALRKAEEAGESTHSAPRPRSRMRMAEWGGVVFHSHLLRSIVLFCLVVSCVRPGGRSALAALAAACFWCFGGGELSCGGGGRGEARSRHFHGSC